MEYTTRTVPRAAPTGLPLAYDRAPDAVIPYRSSGANNRGGVIMRYATLNALPWRGIEPRMHRDDGGTQQAMHAEQAPLELSILLPCLNEAETLASCIQKAQSFLAASGVDGEVLVSDNGSTDGSQDIARNLGARVVNAAPRGYGAALIQGIDAARGTYIIMGDADDSYDLANLSPFLEKLRSGSDFVIGDRFKGGIDPDAMPFLHQHVGNPILSFIGRLLFNSPIRDFHCGLRGFRREAIQKLHLRASGMEFASEMVVRATMARMPIDQVPTVLHKDRRSRKPHLRTWSDGWRHLRFMFLFAPNWLFLYPGVIMVGAGALLGGRLLIGPIQLGRVSLDIQTLLAAALVFFLGFQTTHFFIISRVIAIRHGLLPAGNWITQASGAFRLEGGLLLGGALLLVGAALLGLAIWKWSELSFGALSASQSMRLIIPSVFTIVAGAQIILSSFLISILWVTTE